jgi:hypothetical protein
MSNELVSAASLTNLPSTDVTDLSAYQTESKFLPRLQLFGSNAQVKSGKIGPGRWGIPRGEEVEDLGKEIDALVIGYRMKALDTNGEDNVVVYDVNDPVYQEIKTQAATYVPGGSGCMEGPEFLLYIRGLGFCNYFCMNKSAQITASNMRQFLPINEQAAQRAGCEPQGPQSCTLSAKFIEKPRLSWWAPEVAKCSTPVECDLEELVKQLNKFLNPEVEEVETSDGEDR